MAEAPRSRVRQRRNGAAPRAESAAGRIPGILAQLGQTPVQRRDGVPKHQQTREILIEAIRSGRFAPGSKLPSTKEISSLVNVSLMTAHRALEDLDAMGWLRREVGRGTFVREDIDLQKDQIREISICLILEHSENLNIDDYYHGTLINGLRKEARNDSCQAEFFFHDRFHIRGGRRHAEVGAICIHPTLERQSSVEELARRHPLVVLGGSFANTPVACVDSDNEMGGREAVRHLLSLGHRRILLLSGPYSLSNSRDRAEAAVAELAAHGIRLRPQDLLISRDTIAPDDETKACLERAFAGPDRPTAVFAGGFYLALAVMNMVRNRGLRIPQDVSIIGFDDPASAALLDPPLTTVRQPLEALAARAYVSVRDALLSGTMRATSVRLPPTLVVRNSTGPAPR